jgi:hypothetical protein
MTGVSTIILAALAGLNPWVVLAIVVGLATFTRHAPLNEPYSQAAGALGLSVLGLLLGVDVVVSKLRDATRFVEPVTVPAAAIAGALFPLALLTPTGNEALLVGVGLLAALAARCARYWLTRRLERPLNPMGHVATGMLSDLVAGTLTAAVFAIKP